MKKKINFKPASDIRSSFDVDQWVREGDIPSVNNVIREETAEKEVIVEKEEMYRLSLDIPKYLHKRIKKTCAIEGVSIKAKLTELLLKEFPEK